MPFPPACELGHIFPVGPTIIRDGCVVSLHIIEQRQVHANVSHQIRQWGHIASCQQAFPLSALFAKAATSPMPTVV